MRRRRCGKAREATRAIGTAVRANVKKNRRRAFDTKIRTCARTPRATYTQSITSIYRILFHYIIIIVFRLNNHRKY